MNTSIQNSLYHIEVYDWKAQCAVSDPYDEAVSGKLIDTSAGSTGVGSKTITFTSSNGPYPASVTTASDGTYKATFIASNTIFNGWIIRAYFAGDSLYNVAASTVV